MEAAFYQAGAYLTNADILIWSHTSHPWHRTILNDMAKVLLVRDHAQLCNFGVEGYGWDLCWYDHCLSVTGWLMMQIQRNPFNSAVDLWIFDPRLNAFEDLECEDLIP